ncbi:MAG: hypothetical protein K9M55_10440 [Candidatus Marinimicrobia bacterium]|nr:hypothetical protein [Candidatus Neomarinimicrobiota bacterium]MCF7923106.1 hypothetical protein [Candidatus Neomarinimicrobiota bacterium]
MKLNILDFLTGFLLMNAMPHLIFGIIRLRFLSLFGFSAVGNLLYALVNVVTAGAIYHYQYDITSMKQDGILVGALTMFGIFLITGRFFVGLFQPKSKPALPGYLKEK